MSAFLGKYGPWAIVAGASEGVGRSFANAIAARGVNCLLIAKHGPLEEVAGEVRAHGVECVTAQIDLAAPDAIAQIVAAAGTREIGLYVANAGSDRVGARFHEREIAVWLKLLQLNVVTTMQACHRFGGLMKERGRGGLVLVNSGACYGGASILATYSACKGFLLNFAEGLWAELRPHGVDVLTIALGKTDTPMFRGMLERNGLPIPPDLAPPDAVAECALDRLPHGPIHNWGLADDEPGANWPSAAARRAHVLEIDAGSAAIFGKTMEA
ncbi:MAG: SDR family NAD(P)-dependent oxidoreductase [Sphingomonadales bacterium]|nr:SDR family NAD(P)-dependent oxidoreductase [Sphingomonadales bacterium]